MTGTRLLPRFLVAAAALLLTGAGSAPEVGSPAFEFVATDKAIKAVGRWAHKMVRGRTFVLSPTNSAEVHCSRGTMMCWENRAELMTGPEPKKAASLTVKSTPFKITEWTEARVIARTDMPEGDLALRIDLKGRAVQLSYWDAKPDASTGKADGFVWELR